MIENGIESQILQKIIEKQQFKQKNYLFRIKKSSSC